MEIGTTSTPDSSAFWAVKPRPRFTVLPSSSRILSSPAQEIEQIFWSASGVLMIGWPFSITVSTRVSAPKPTSTSRLPEGDIAASSSCGRRP